LWDLANPSSKPVRELADERRRSSSINCVAFSPNGHWCATGGEDNMVCLWDVDSGTLLQKMQSHRGRVTSVQFLSPTQLVTCGGDKVLCLWTLADDGKPKFLNRFEGRGGEVTQLGVDPAKKEVLFDQGKELHVLAMPGGEFEGALQNPSRAMGFTTMALFSPDAKLVLTNDASRNYLQLWRAPNPKTRAYELRQLVWDGQPTTCGAFSPDGTFMVTGTADRHVLVWPVPTPKEVDEQLTAKVTTLENSVEGDLNKVRMKAELTNPGYLMPGDKATLVVYPRR
jgi:WD40 repeat protein